jgi:hypothetical protein
MSLKDGSLLPGWPVDRDFAMLMIEAARSLGFGSRFASGYLAVPLADPTELLNTAWDSRSVNIISFVAEGGAGNRLTFLWQDSHSRFPPEAVFDDKHRPLN